MHAGIAFKGGVALAKTDQHADVMQNMQSMLYEAMRHINLQP